MQAEEDIHRDRWSSRTVFILAAIGSAVGLGNVWRFPYLVAYYGGGTFLIPYTICLVAFGMPILLLELASGQKFQGGDVEAFGAMNPRLRGIGLMSIFNAFTIITYYSVIIAWALCFAMQSLAKLPWRSVPEATAFFWGEVVQIRDINTWGEEGGLNDPYRIDENRSSVGTNWDGSWRALMALLVTWGCVYLSVFKGVRSAGEVVKFTMPIPVLLLVIIMIAACTLDGAGDGLDQYLGNWDMEVLSDNSIWSAATGQVFFTLSVTMGIMTAYSSFNPENQNLVIDEKLISLGDYSIAFISGFTIYAALGNAVKECGDDPAKFGIGDPADCDGLYGTKSMGLAFIMMAYVTSTIPGEAFWSFIWFVALFLLGIDSAFSMIEAVTTVIGDTQVARRMHWRKEMVTANVCVVAFLLAALFTFDTGLFWLDIIDWYINSYGLLITGVLECIAVGWIYKIEVQIEKMGMKPVVIYNVTSMVAVIVGCMIGFLWPRPNRPDGLSYTSGPSPAIVAAVASMVGITIWLGGMVCAIMVAPPSTSMFDRFRYIVGWEGCDDLRKVVNRHAYPDWEPYTRENEMKALTSSTTIPIYWCFFIKYLAPVTIFVMWCDVVRNGWYMNYGDYTNEQLQVGAGLFWFSMCLFIMPVLAPVMFMSDKGALEYQGWDIFRAMGFEPTNWTWAGFGQHNKDEEANLIRDEKKAEAEMVGVQTAYGSEEPAQTAE